jgi:hypothetical protein
MDFAGYLSLSLSLVAGFENLSEPEDFSWATAPGPVLSVNYCVDRLEQVLSYVVLLIKVWARRTRRRTRVVEVKADLNPPPTSVTTSTPMMGRRRVQAHHRREQRFKHQWVWTYLWHRQRMLVLGPSPKRRDKPML